MVRVKRRFSAATCSARLSSHLRAGVDASCSMGAGERPQARGRIRTKTSVDSRGDARVELLGRGELEHRIGARIVLGMPAASRNIGPRASAIFGLHCRYPI